MDIIDIISNLFGVSANVSESILVTALFISSFVLLRLLWIAMRIVLVASKKDTKQIDIEQSLVGLASTAIEENKLLRKSYESNTQTIKDMCLVLTSMKDSFKDVVNELKTVVTEVQDVKEGLDNEEDIKKYLFKTSETKVVVKDSDNNIFARFTAIPEADGGLVIKFDSVFE